MGDKKEYPTGQRLKRVARQLYDGNVSDLARAVDMQPSSFYKYIHGDRRPGTDVLTRMTLLGIDIHWFLTGEGQMLRSTGETSSPLPLLQDTNEEDEESSTEALQRIPLLRLATDENGTPVLKEAGTAEWLPKSFIRRTYGTEPALLKCFRVSGDAMRDSLRPGDRVRGVLWTGESLTDGAIYLIYSDPGIAYRRVRFAGDVVRLTADHSEIEPQTVEVDAWRQDFRPVAQILEFARAL